MPQDLSGNSNLGHRMRENLEFGFEKFDGTFSTGSFVKDVLQGGSLLGCIMERYSCSNFSIYHVLIYEVIVLFSNSLSSSGWANCDRNADRYTQWVMYQIYYAL
jgi:hypothetical protein